MFGTLFAWFYMVVLVALALLPGEAIDTPQDESIIPLGYHDPHGYDDSFHIYSEVTIEGHGKVRRILDAEGQRYVSTITGKPDGIRWEVRPSLSDYNDNTHDGADCPACGSEYCIGFECD